MKIGIYNPYLDTLGGHERYCLDIASGLKEMHDVYFFWDDPEILKKASRRFGIATEGIHVAQNIWKYNFLCRMHHMRTYDAIFFVSDGSIPLIASKKSYLLFEFPVPWVHGKSWRIQAKIRRFSKIICNSPYVKKYIDSTFGISSDVLLPGVDVKSFHPGKKEQLILSVGRFTTGMNTKKQLMLITAFKELCKRGLAGWKLIMVGGMLKRDQAFVDTLRTQIKNFPVTLVPNATFKELQDLYSSASIYWHAAGFGEDLENHPERAEHFGISTVESMSAGVVPVVFNGGGQKDIVQNGVNGYLWNTKDELIKKTEELAINILKRKKMAAQARFYAQQFSRDSFIRRLLTLFNHAP